ncbi:hypothetical protein PIB30_087139 [Stylosanthes scabra]|uniref:CUE domain-containing protein n=1 Tax=Stylosanthes scabra TaxID=79078 RepID=A0ABU6STK5_9FABA|nr:hypothetical protein [Stylosanthes scabra]
MFPDYGHIPQPCSLPGSSSRHMSSYPQFMHSVAPYLAEQMDPQSFNILYSMINDFDMSQQAKAMEEAQMDLEHHNQSRPGRLSIDSHFHAPAASGHSAARQSFDSSRSFYGRGIGEDGVHRNINARQIDLNNNDSSIQEDEEAARYTRYTKGSHSNTHDIDMDEDEEEDYLVEDGNPDDTEDLACAG